MADGKSGTAYLLNAAHLAGVGGQLAQARVCASYGGMAAAGTVALRALPLRPDGGGDHRGIRVLWRGPGGAQGSPVLGGGAVWVADWNSGVLYELSPASGQVRDKISLGGALAPLASPPLSSRLVLLGGMHGVVAVSGA